MNPVNDILDKADSRYFTHDTVKCLPTTSLKEYKT